MQKYAGINESLGSEFKGESLFLVAASPDNDIDRCMPIGIFKDIASAEKHRDACDKYDEMNFHHVIELPVNPEIKW